jgi:Ca2+-binding EF-hand superfamily protein
MKNFSILTLALTFLVALPSYSNTNIEKNNLGKVRKRFEKVDKNGDGLLSKEEMIAAHRDRLDNLFKNFDKNGDNKLSRKELRAVKKEMKKRINNNKNKGE